MAIAGRKYKILLFLLAVLVIALAGERIWTEFRLRKIERHDSAAKLALENNHLRSEIDQLNRQAKSTGYAQELRLASFDSPSKSVDITFDKPTLVWFVSCAENNEATWKSVDRLLQESPAEDHLTYIVVFVGSRDKAEVLRQQMPGGVQCYSDDSGISLGIFGISALPACALVPPDRLILGRWMGQDFTRKSSDEFAREVQLALGKAAATPALTLFTPQGAPVGIHNEERGKAFFLFSTDCETCEAEAEKWPALADRLKTLGYAVHFVCVEGIENIADYAKKHDFADNVLLDRQGVMASEYGVAFTPCRIITGVAGNIEYKDVRQLLPGERLAALDKFLEQKELLAGKDALDYVQEVFPEANRCVPRTFTGKGFGDVYFEVFKDATRLGFARKVHREIACDVCGDVDFVVGIDMAGRIRKVELLSGEDDIELPKRIGISVFISACIALVTGLISSRRKWFGAKPYKRLFVSLALFTVLSAVSYASIEIAFPRMSAPEFLRQFDGRRVEPSLRLKADGGDVQSMTGATKSSREIAKGLVETLSLFENDAPPEGKTLENHNNTQ
jgi:peroxiredoxin